MFSSEFNVMPSFYVTLLTVLHKYLLYKLDVDKFALLISIAVRMALLMLNKVWFVVESFHTLRTSKGPAPRMSYLMSCLQVGQAFEISTTFCTMILLTKICVNCLYMII